MKDRSLKSMHFANNSLFIFSLKVTNQGQATTNKRPTSTSRSLFSLQIVDSGAATVLENATIIFALVAVTL